MMDLFSEDLLLDPDRHAESLEKAAARALSESRAADAFAFADRRCRIGPLAEAPHFLLRAATLVRLGEPDAALDDVRRALEIEPENLMANRSLLTSPETEERLRAAHTLVRFERRPRVLADALSVLEGLALSGCGALEASQDGIEGWLAWRGEATLDLHLVWEQGEAQHRITPDPAHPLAGALGSAAAWRTPWPDGARSLRVTACARAFLLFGSPLPRPGGPSTSSVRTAGSTARPDHSVRRRVAIVVPVYDDFDATRTCLETLLADEPVEVERRIISIDDVTPDPRIASLLDEAAAAGTVELLRNTDNLGFAASVNRALANLVDEDLLLLNADTVLPHGFLDRLFRAAHASPDIGTVTPLSNNGEYTSLPIAFRENALPSREAIVAIDRIAARVNAGLRIDMPNGTGFCLYVTRACLDRIGPLSTCFGRGYFEDVEFCLRAAAAGFRNICTTDVYVGHAGTRSFKSDKRALVARNLPVIEKAHPGYRQASAAFLARDPLMPARQAIEGQCLKAFGPAHLFVVAEATPRVAVDERIRALVADGARVLVAEVGARAGWLTVALQDAAGGFPQNASFSHPLGNATTGLIEDLQALAVARIEIADLAAIPAAFVVALRTLGCPYDLYVRDPGFVCPRHAVMSELLRDCALCGGECPCDLEGPVFGAEGSLEPDAARRVWSSAVVEANRIVVPSRDLAWLIEESFAAMAPPVVVASLLAGPEPRAPASVYRAPGRLVVIAPGRQRAVFGLLNAVARELAMVDDSLSLVVIGPTFDDLRLMASGRVFVTGEVEPDEVPGLLSRFAASRLFFPERRGGPGDPHRVAAERSGLPAAYFDWNVGESRSGYSEDLRLHPSAAAPVVAAALRAWMSGAARTAAA